MAIDAMTEMMDVATLEALSQYMTDKLMAICEIDTSIRSDVEALATAESQVFDILETEIAAMQLENASLYRQGIDPKIADHPFFSQLYYTQNSQYPNGRTPVQTYEQRCNLIFQMLGDHRQNQGVNQAVNAHIDVVGPYFGPTLKEGKVFGRGSCDDKGNIIVMLGALKLVNQYLQNKQIKLNKNLTFMFVIEEEMGGNGSLCAALDEKLTEQYESLMVLECCTSEIYPGNRGCVWYKIEATIDNVNMFECSSFIIEQLEIEGGALKAESDHPLFPHRPVQTCHGIIGDCGEHPSRINAQVAFEIVGDTEADLTQARKLIDDVIDAALKNYVALYGDKTQVIDALTGKPKVDHHLDIQETNAGLRITVLGSSGHMGSILENDGAITKMMMLVRALIRSRAKIQAFAGGQVQYQLAHWDNPSKLILEGGQGFLPTHNIENVQRRMCQATYRGADAYFAIMKLNHAGADELAVSFEKLHNAAFAGKPDSDDMATAITCAKQAGIWKDKPIRGWDVSCDARIFACQHPHLNVLTAGPGSLEVAHSDREFIDIQEMVKFTQFLALYILKQTGTLD